MNTQTAYELMRVYLTRSGARQALDETGECAYETEIDGAKHRCAVGCLLTPQAIDELVEQNALSGVGVEFIMENCDGNVPIASNELKDVDRNFLNRAQALHDEEEYWPNGKFNVISLDSLADEFGLKVVTDEPQGAPRREKIHA